MHLNLGVKVPKFPDPPLRTSLHKVAPTKDDPAGIMSEGWQKYLVASTNRHTQPNIPVVTVAPTTGQPGDLRTDGGFLYICTALNTWKKVVLT